MKLVRYGDRGAERPGLIDAAGILRDLSGEIDDVRAELLDPAVLVELGNLDPQSLPEVNGSPRIGAPVSGIGKIICVGLNYTEHAEESRMEVPDEPVLFMKATSAINGPYDDLVLPRGAAKADWEVELVAVIGTRASYVTVENALQHVAGYCVGNDVSERAFQLEHGGQWLKGKSADTFAPIGPWLVTSDEVSGIDSDIWLEVDGVRQQESSTSNMIFGVAEIISYISRFMTLLPGDLVFTGTPPGVALGKPQPNWLQPGSRIRCGIEGLGEQNQVVVSQAQ